MEARIHLVPVEDNTVPQGFVRSIEDIEEYYPNVVRKSEYTLMVKFFSVPLKLVSGTTLRRKLYSLTRSKENFVRGELERLKANNIIRNSDSPFASQGCYSKDCV